MPKEPVGKYGTGTCQYDKCKKRFPKNAPGQKYCPEPAKCKALSYNESRRKNLGDGECLFCHKTFKKCTGNQKYCARPATCKADYEAAQKRANTVKSCRQCGDVFTVDADHKVYCPKCADSFDPAAYADTIDPIDVAKQQIKEQAEQKAYKAWLAGEAKEELLMERFTTATEAYPPRETHRFWTPITKTDHAREHAVLILADPHFGELVSSEDTGGLADCNIDLLADRIRHGFSTAADISENVIRRAGIPLDDLHVLLMGDNVTGEFIFGSQPFHIDLPLEQQAIIGADLTSRAIMSLADSFERTTVVGVKGNHGEHRQGNKVKSKTNFDRLFYDGLQRRMSLQEDITTIIPRAWWYVHQINGWGFLMQHKNQGQSSLGTPYYAMDRDEKAMRSMLMNLDKTFFYYLVAHWHHEEEAELPYGQRIVCPSIVGGTQFSTEELRRSSVPRLLFFGVSEKYGITWRFSVRCDMIPPEMQLGADLEYTCAACGAKGYGIPEAYRAGNPVCLQCAEAA